MRRENASTCKTIPVLGIVSCCPSSAPVVHVINTQTQLELINNLPCYLTDQINIPVV